MSGIIDEQGVQWEHCCNCGKYVRLDNLGYEKPSPKHKHGRDLCLTCVNTGIRADEIEFNNIVPSAEWSVIANKEPA